MDHTHVRGIKSFKIKKLSHYLHHHTFTSLRSLFFYSMVATTLTILCTSPLWIPYFQTLLFTYLPNFFSIFLDPRSLFLLGNLIVIFLVRGSKIHYNANSTTSSSLSLQSSQAALFPLPTTTMCFPPNKDWKMSFGDLDEDGECDAQEAMIMVGEDLRRRADNFIAKVNRQIMFEGHDDDELL